MKKIIFSVIIAFAVGLLTACSFKKTDSSISADMMSTRAPSSPELQKGRYRTPELQFIEDSTAIPGDETAKDILKPEIELEFWITENVDEVDFSKYQEKLGMVGGKAYYGTGYVPTIDEDGYQVDPEHCIWYVVTSYPDYADMAEHITVIHITDPDIEIYGITTESTADEFRLKITQQGFEIVDYNEFFMLAQKDNILFSLSFAGKEIIIRAIVSNKEGLIF